MKHLKSNHAEQARLVQEEQEVTKRLKAEQTPAKQAKQVTIKSALERSQLYGRESPRRKTIDEAVVRMLAIDLQPALIVEDKGFLLFLYTIDPKYAPPSRHTIMSSHLPECYQKVKQKLKTKLAEGNCCALTTDLWTSIATQGYITVTCHFISSANDFPRSRKTDGIHGFHVLKRNCCFRYF